MFQLRMYTLRVRPKLSSGMRRFTGPTIWQPSRRSGSPPTVCGHSDPAVRTDSSR